MKKSWILLSTAFVIVATRGESWGMPGGGDDPWQATVTAQPSSLPSQSPPLSPESTDTELSTFQNGLNGQKSPQIPPPPPAPTDKKSFSPPNRLQRSNTLGPSVRWKSIPVTGAILSPEDGVTEQIRVKRFKISSNQQSITVDSRDNQYCVSKMLQAFDIFLPKIIRPNMEETKDYGPELRVLVQNFSELASRLNDEWIAHIITQGAGARATQTLRGMIELLNINPETLSSQSDKGSNFLQGAHPLKKRTDKSYLERFISILQKSKTSRPDIELMDIFLTHLLAIEEMIPATARTKEGLKKAWYQFLAEQNWGQFQLAGYTLKLDNELKTEIEKIAPKLPIQPAPSINEPSAMSVPPQIPVVQLRTTQENTTKQTETTLSPKQPVGQKPKISRKPDLSRSRSLKLGANPLVTPVSNTAVGIAEVFRQRKK